jgi:hypothetical protein
MLRALYHATARLYYTWALASIHPAHHDAGYVQLRHAMHSIELERWLEGKA